jgi:hypothetical protein
MVVGKRNNERLLYFLIYTALIIANVFSSVFLADDDDMPPLDDEGVEELD